ncbi:MAG: hypothetical protein ABEJ48_04975 [Halobacteriales archaeon]
MAVLSSGRQRLAVFDLLILGLLASGLAAIFYFVPSSLQDPFAFRHDFSNPVSLVSAAYLHLTEAHLLGNLGGFAVAASYTYLFCWHLEERRWFWLTTLAFLTILPILVNLTSHGVFRFFYPVMTLPSSRGFSGVVAGYGGFLFVAVTVFFARQFSPAIGRVSGQLLSLVVLTELTVVYGTTRHWLGFGLVGLGLVLIGIELSRLWRATDGALHWQRVVLGAGVIAAVGVVLSWLVLSLFPPTIIQGGSFTNVFAHAAGFIYGAVVSRWGYRYWHRRD